MSFNAENLAPETAVLLDGTFRDMESLARSVGWDVTFRQIEPGPLQANALLIGNRSALVMRVSFDRAFHQVGTPPPGYLSFGLSDATNQPLLWRGLNAEPGALVNFNGPDRLDVTSKGTFRAWVLSFTHKALSGAANLLEQETDLAVAISNSGFWTPAPADRAVLGALLDEIEQAARSEMGQGLREHREAFDVELALRVLKIISNPMDLPSNSGSHFRQNVLRRALDVIESANLTDLTVADLCHACSASWSTLERAFDDEFGVGPKRYLQARRLAAVNRELVLDRTRTVAEVANEWGFWHMGNFAAIYRKQFGELPSETLSRDGK